MISLFFKPIVSLLNQFGFSAKFSLIFVLFLIPVTYIAYTTITVHSENIRTAEKEKSGVEYLIALKPLYTKMAQTRGMTNAYLNGKQTLNSKILDKRQQLKQVFENLKVIDKQLSDELKTAARVSEIYSKWDKLQKKSFDLSAAESFSQHTQIIELALALNEHVIESSGLILDSDAISHFMMDASFHRLPVLIENMGKARGLGAGIASAGRFTPESHLQLVNYINTINTALNSMNHSIEVVFNESADYEKQLAENVKTANESTMKFLKLSMQELISAKNINIDANDYFNNGTAAISSVLTLFDAVIPVLRGVLSDRIATYKAQITAYILFGALLLSLAVYIYLSVFIKA